MENYLIYVLKINLLAAVCILLVLAVSRALKRKFSAKWRYLLWFLIAIFLLLPMNLFQGERILEIRLDGRREAVGAETPTGGNRTEDEQNVSAESGTVQQKTEDTAGLLGEEAQMSESGGGRNGGLQAPVAETPWEHASGETTASPETPAFEVSVSLILYMLGLAWAAGFAFWSTYRLLTYRLFLSRIKRAAIPVGDLRVRRIFKAVCMELGVKKQPVLAHWGGADSPLIAGILHSYLILPENDYTAEELRLIFLHELNHYRHRDLWYKNFLLAVRTFYWFNPLLGVMLREADADLELICDGRVVGVLQGEERGLYHRLLLKTAVSGGGMGRMAAGLRDGAGRLKDRFLYMARIKAMKNGAALAVLLAMALLSANFLVGCTLERGQTEEPDRGSSLETSSVGEEGGLTEEEIAEKLSLEYIGNQFLTAEERIAFPEGCISAFQGDMDGDGSQEILAAVTESDGESYRFTLRIYEHRDGAWAEQTRREFVDSEDGQFQRTVMLSGGWIILNSASMDRQIAAVQGSMPQSLSLASVWPLPVYNGYGSESYYRYQDGELTELPAGTEGTEYSSWCRDAVPFCSFLYSYMDTVLLPEEEADPYNWKKEYPSDLYSYLFRTVDGAALEKIVMENFCFSLPPYFEDYISFSEIAGHDQWIGGASAISPELGGDVFRVSWIQPSSEEYNDGPDSLGWPAGVGGSRLLWRGASSDIIYAQGGGDSLASLLYGIAEKDTDKPLETLHILYTLHGDSQMILYTFQYTGTEQGTEYPLFP